VPAPDLIVSSLTVGAETKICRRTDTV